LPISWIVEVCEYGYKDVESGLWASQHLIMNFEVVMKALIYDLYIKYLVAVHPSVDNVFVLIIFV